MSYLLTRRMSLLLLGVVTLALAIGVLFFVIRLAAFKSSFKLLYTAGLLWISNILVFTLWYWDTDGGGPRKRHEAAHKAVGLMFPQQANGEGWAPQFSTISLWPLPLPPPFSPTDTYPLTTKAKSLMMVQSVISLIIIALLVSRVANIVQ